MLYMTLLLWQNALDKAKTLFVAAALAVAGDNAYIPHKQLEEQE